MPVQRHRSMISSGPKKNRHRSEHNGVFTQFRAITPPNRKKEAIPIHLNAPYHNPRVFRQKGNHWKGHHPLVGPGSPRTMAVTDFLAASESDTVLFRLNLPGSGSSVK